MVYRLVFSGQTRKEGESWRRDRGMLFSVIGAAWLIVLCLADKREKKARADGETEACRFFLSQPNRRLIHVRRASVVRPSFVNHNFQSTSPKLLGESKPNVTWGIYGKGHQKFL